MRIAILSIVLCATSALAQYVDGAILNWLQNHTYPPDANDSDLVVVSIPTAASSDASIVQWQSGIGGTFGFQVSGTWDSVKNQLNTASLYIDIPGFGNAVLFSNQSILLPSNPIEINITDTGIQGVVQFSLQERQDDTTKQDVRLSWQIMLPWVSDKLNDGRNLFPADNQSAFLRDKLPGIPVITPSESSAVRAASPFQHRSSGELMQFLDSDDDLSDKELARSFIQDHVVSGNPVVALATQSGVKIQEQSVDISFLIFQLVGSVMSDKLFISATLYAKIPYIGRVELVKAVGSLLGAGVPVNINLVLASGLATVKAQKTASALNYDLFINLSAKIKFVNNIKTGDLKLLTLPF